MQLHEEIMELLKKKAKSDFEYINPNFLIAITELIYDLYNVEEDEEIDKWIQDMYGT